MRNLDFYNRIKNEPVTLTEKSSGGHFEITETYRQDGASTTYWRTNSIGNPLLGQICVYKDRGGLVVVQHLAHTNAQTEESAFSYEYLEDVGQGLPALSR